MALIKVQDFGVAKYKPGGFEINFEDWTLVIGQHAVCSTIRKPGTPLAFRALAEPLWICDCPRVDPLRLGSD